MRRATTWRAVWSVAMALAVWTVGACDDGNGNGPGPIPTPDVLQGEQTLPITQSAEFAWSIPASVPPRNEQCPDFDPGTYGSAFVEWAGFTQGGTTYSCNECPRGKELYQGAWRAMFATADPDVPANDPSYRERITFNGNLFTMDLFDDATGAARFEGFYWCGQQPEVANENYFFVITKTDKEGAFGFKTGSIFSARVLSTAGGVNEFLAYWWFSFEKTESATGSDASNPYCKIGIDVVTPRVDGQGNNIVVPCADPFGS